MKYTVQLPETEQRISTVDHLERAEGTLWQLSMYDSKQHETKLSFTGVSVTLVSGQLEIRFPDGSREVFPAAEIAADGSILIASPLGAIRLQALRGAASDAAMAQRAAHKSIKSSMPGKVLKLLCKPGDHVEPGQPLLIIEAMKMENEIRAPQAGVVEQIPVQPGQTVETGALLMMLGTGE